MGGWWIGLVKEPVIVSDPELPDYLSSFEHAGPYCYPAIVDSWVLVHISGTQKMAPGHGPLNERYKQRHSC